MSEILLAEIIPDGWLSLQVRSNSAHSYLVRLDGTDEYVVPVTPELGQDIISAVTYLPKVCQVSGSVSVTVTPLDADGDPIGAESPAVTAPWVVYSPERVVRQRVAECIHGANIGAWVHFDRMGRPVTIPDHIGRRGDLVEVGVSYTSSETPHADSDYTDTNIVVPIRVLAKGDTPEAGQNAVDIAYQVRGILTESLDMLGYGISTWEWSGSEPSQAKDSWVCEMTMSITQVREQGVCRGGLDS